MTRKLSATPSRRARGRPPKAAAERKRRILSMRMRDATMATLVQRAAANGRSLSEEAEALIENALQAGDLLDQVLDLSFGRQAAGLLLLLGSILRDTGNHAGFMKTHTLAGASEWLDVPFAFDQAKQAVDAVFEALYPAGDREPPMIGRIPGRPDFDNLITNLGAGFATTVLLAVDGEARGVEHKEVADKVRPRLGPQAIERIKQWIRKGEAAHV
jgi:hypothetical protein